MREDYYAEYFRTEDWHWWYIGRRQIFLALLDRYLGRAADGATRRILDFGCGTGAMLGCLNRYGEAIGVDADEHAIRFCHQRGLENVKLLESDRLPFPDGSFDLVTALDVLEHIPDDRVALREVDRVLRGDGIFLAAVPAHRGLWGAQDEISHHKRRYSRSELKSRIGESGLDLLRLTYFNTLLSPPIAAIRLARRLRRSPLEVRSDLEMNKEGRLNDLLAGIFGLEARWLRTRNFPLGISLLALARRPE
jgi:SAM-dependent methyltransferase